MKQYLLTEDQIERMLACAISLGIDADSKEHLIARTTNQRVQQPEKGSLKNALVLWEQLKQIEIIQPINQN